MGFIKRAVLLFVILLSTTLIACNSKSYPCPDLSSGSDGKDGLPAKRSNVKMSKKGLVKKKGSKKLKRG